MERFPLRGRERRGTTPRRDAPVEASRDNIGHVPAMIVQMRMKILAAADIIAEESRPTARRRRSHSRANAASARRSTARSHGNERRCGRRSP